MDQKGCTIPPLERLKMIEKFTQDMLNVAEQ